MLKFNGILLASDFDGTLLNNNREISQENLKAIAYFVENGGCFSPATGRVPQAALPYCDKIPVNAPCIFLNGAVIYSAETKQNIKVSSLPREALELVKVLMSEFHMIGIEIFTPDAAYIVQMNEVTKWHFERLHLPMITVNIDHFLPTNEWYKINVTGNPNLLSKVMFFLQPYRNYFEMSSSNALFYEITALGSHKGNALNYVANYLNIKKENVFAIGDSFNDLSMLKAASKSFAPANADEVLRKQADILVSDNNNHAIYDVIMKLEEWYS